MNTKSFLDKAIKCPGCDKTEDLSFDEADDAGEWTVVTCKECGWMGPPDLGYSGAVERWNKRNIDGPFYIDRDNSDDERLYIDIDGFSIAIIRTDQGLIIGVWPLTVANEPLATMTVWFDDLSKEEERDAAMEEEE